LKVRTKGYHGNIVKGGTVVSNDPKSPKRFLRISAQVQPLISCSPSPYISLTKPYGRQDTRIMALWSPVHTEFKIQNVESLIPHVSARIIKTWAEKKWNHYNLKITFERDMRIGQFRGIIRIATNLKKSPTYDLRVSGMVEGPVKVLPRRGSMFSDQAIAEGMATAGFNIYGSQKGLKIRKVTSGMKGLMTRLITVQEGGKYYLVAIWPGGPIPVNPYSTLLKVYTNNAVQPIIRIPVNIYSRKVVKGVPAKRVEHAPPPTVKPPEERRNKPKARM